MMARKWKNIDLRQVRKISMYPHKNGIFKKMARDFSVKLIENIQQ